MIWCRAPKFNLRAAALEKTRVVHQIDAPHRAQPGWECPAADNAGGNREVLALRPP